MKKIFLLLAFISFIAFSTTSCKKCITCAYKYKYLDDTITVAFPENCTKKKDQNLLLDLGEFDFGLDDLDPADRIQLLDLAEGILGYLTVDDRVDEDTKFILGSVLDDIF